MKKRFTPLLFLALLLCSVQTFAQAPTWEIKINDHSGLNKLCAGGPAITVHLWYQGTYNVTSSTTFFVSQDAIIGPDGQANGSPIISSPSYYPYTGILPENPGVVTIYAYNGSSIVCSLTVYVYPNGTTLNSITGVSPAIDQGVYNFVSGYQFTGPTTYTIGGPYASYYTASTSGTTCTVTPNLNAPLIDYVDVGASWIPTGSPCGLTAYGGFVGRINRTPTIAATNNLNVLCSGGANVLSVTNASDISGYPGTPSPTTLPHYVYQWYNSSGQISGATNSTYTATAAGSYHVVISQYNYYGTWSTTPEVGSPATSNTITLSTPGTGTLTPSFTINGTTPATTQGSATNYFNCDPIIFANTSTVGTGGVINTYEIDIKNPSGTTIWTQTGNTTPPSSQDLESVFQTAGTAGVYEIILTVTNGCSVNNTHYGYIYVSGAPSPSGTLEISTYNSGLTQEIHYTSPDGIDAWHPDMVGPTSTNFVIGGSFASISLACSYTPSIYATPYKYNPQGLPISPLINFNTAVPLWTGATVTEDCSQPLADVRVITTLGTPGFWTGTGYGLYPGEYYVDFKLVNDCGTSHVGAYVQVDAADYARMSNEGVNSVTSNDNTINFYPVPFTDKVNVNINAAEDATANLVIYTVDGRTISTVLQNEAVAHGQTVKTINTANWPAGVYFYKLMLGNKVYSGKITK